MRDEEESFYVVDTAPPDWPCIGTAANPDLFGPTISHVTVLNSLGLHTFTPHWLFLFIPPISSDEQCPSLQVDEWRFPQVDRQTITGKKKDRFFFFQNAHSRTH